MRLAADVEILRSAILPVLADPSAVCGLEPAQLDFTLRVLRRARLLARVAWHLRARGLLDRLDSQAQDALLGALAVTDARERAIRWELDRIAWALGDAPLGPVILAKGCAYLLLGLPNAAGRLVADVDMLVSEKELAGFEARLRARGWQSPSLSDYDERYYRVWAHELPPLTHPEREIEVDAHHNIVMRTARHRVEATRLITASQPLPGTRFHVLSPPDMVLHAIAHAFAGGELKDALRDLVDIDDLLRHYSSADADFWESLVRRAQELDLARPLFLALRYCAGLLGTPVPGTAVATVAPGRSATAVLLALDRCVPRALLPAHPDRPSWRRPLACGLLLVRSHWLRMPAPLLVRHLLYKTWLRVAARRSPG